jgi:hypothetical protein
MYRIELAPGEVTVFRTIEELATGVRNGVITPRARIFHAATDKWLPIEFHPHYKKARETPTGQPIDVPAVHRAPAIERREEPELVSAPIATASPVLQLPRISYPEVATSEEPAPAPAPATRTGGAPRRPLHLAALALVLAVGGYVVVSAFSPAPTHVAAVPAPRPVTVRVESMSAGATHSAAPRPAAQQTPPRPMPPASSGFAPALEARAIASGPMPPRDTAPAVPALAPAPETDLGSAPAVDVSLPDLGTDSLSAVARQRDSTHLRQILRAVSPTDTPAP